MATKNYKELLKDIKVFIFDIDGVLTDGQVLITKEEYIRSIHAKDAYAIQYASKIGYQLFVISGGYSPTLNEKLSRLGIKEVCCKSKNKIESYEYLKEKYHFLDDNVVYIGDDLPDYFLMQKVGLATCPQDAAIEIKNICHYQSPFYGGKGCVRDLIEQVLKVQGNWMKDTFFEW
ncbi:MAG: HAD hydrolase family protein [Flavobacteriia bacterium]|nr:HAD hydrolase family protein [Flavobacteriia bacterium]